MKSLESYKQYCVLGFIMLKVIVIMVVPVLQIEDTNLVFAKHGYESPSRDGPNYGINNDGDRNNSACRDSLNGDGIPRAAVIP